jgi:hypothetical protein
MYSQHSEYDLADFIPLSLFPCWQLGCRRRLCAARAQPLRYDLHCAKRHGADYSHERQNEEGVREWQGE